MEQAGRQVTLRGNPSFHLHLNSIKWRPNP